MAGASKVIKARQLQFMRARRKAISEAPVVNSLVLDTVKHQAWVHYIRGYQKAVSVIARLEWSRDCVRVTFGCYVKIQSVVLYGPGIAGKTEFRRASRHFGWTMFPNSGFVFKME